MNNPEDDWVEVELYRWQYGQLPNTGDYRPLNISKALECVAQSIKDACESRDMTKMPNPFNLCEILLYCSRKLS